MTVGLCESGTPEVKAMRAAFRKIVRDNFTSGEVDALARIVDASMLPADPDRPVSR
jgi:hypothetical protein